ncbi:hypothetical protein ACJROX_13165 [Pseudalkalibacillus sp. A8]|uniref:hypothetical protein n=1 Tax=Pseudalkalibacillus sp. A8 TaxID=3382641 RepID=UPI0038B56346
MQDELKKLKETLEQTTFKDFDFDEEKRKKVHETYKRKQRKPTLFGKVNPTFSMIACFMILLGMAFYTLKQGPGPSENEPSTSKPVEISESTDSRKFAIEANVTKDKLISRMENPLAFFDSVQGSFTYHIGSYHHDITEKKHYQIQTGKHSASYIKSIQEDGISIEKISDQHDFQELFLAGGVNPSIAPKDYALWLKTSKMTGKSLAMKKCMDLMWYVSKER